MQTQITERALDSLGPEFIYWWNEFKAGRLKASIEGDFPRAQKFWRGWHESLLKQTPQVEFNLERKLRRKEYLIMRRDMGLNSIIVRREHFPDEIRFFVGSEERVYVPKTAPSPPAGPLP